MKKLIHLSAVLVLFLFVTSCNAPREQEEQSPITTKPFGVMPDGTAVTAYTLKNDNGMEMTVITYGAAITSLKTPDAQGNLGDIVLGFDTLTGYLQKPPYFGAVVGRYGNRIAKGKFSIDGQEYTLATNDGLNHLHGGNVGFDKVIWNATEIQNSDGVGLELTYTSKDMEEGYPGNLKVTVTYLLRHDNVLAIEYRGKTDKKTVINLTQHSYFNLSAMKDENVLGFELTVNADKFLPVDSTLIPTGELRPVTGTPFDFTQAKVVGNDIGADNEQLKLGRGYDHCWVINRSDSAVNTLVFAAQLHDPNSGRTLQVYTTEPAIQVYTGNFLDGTITGKDGIVYKQRAAICLETEHFPDSPNQLNFPSVVLNPDEEYDTKTEFRFSAQ